MDDTKMGSNLNKNSSFQVERHILLVRGEKVMLDSDLATLYEIETRVLTQAVKRNLERFPDDFMFQLNKEEFTLLRSQTAAKKRSPVSFKVTNCDLKRGTGKAS